MIAKIGTLTPLARVKFPKSTILSPQPAGRVPNSPPLKIAIRVPKGPSGVRGSRRYPPRLARSTRSVIFQPARGNIERAHCPDHLNARHYSTRSPPNVTATTYGDLDLAMGRYPFGVKHTQRLLHTGSSRCFP